MKVKKFRPQLRLTTMIRDPGGKLVKDAVESAEAAIAAMRDDCVRTIDEIILAIEIRYGPGSPRTLDDGLFSLAGNLIDASTAARELLVEEAANSLCRLLDVFREAGRADWAAIDVHLQALMFLRSAGPAADATARRDMVRGLLRVVQREAKALGVELAA